MGTKGVPKETDGIVGLRDQKHDIFPGDILPPVKLPVA